MDISEDAVGKISVVFFITVPDGSGSFATAGEAYQGYVEEGSYADSESPAPEPESQGGVQLASGDIDGTPIDRLTGEALAVLDEPVAAGLRDPGVSFLRGVALLLAERDR